VRHGTTEEDAGLHSPTDAVRVGDGPHAWPRNSGTRACAVTWPTRALHLFAVPGRKLGRRTPSSESASKSNPPQRRPARRLTVPSWPQPPSAPPSRRQPRFDAAFQKPSPRIPAVGLRPDRQPSTSPGRRPKQQKTSAHDDRPWDGHSPDSDRVAESCARLRGQVDSFARGLELEMRWSVHNPISPQQPKPSSPQTWFCADRWLGLCTP
jgi:hypothetical protein